LSEPVTVTKTYKYRGKTHRKRVVESTEKRPISVGKLAKSIHDVFWYRLTVSEEAKGPIVYEFTRRRIVLAKDGFPRRRVWLIIRRSLGEDPKYSYFISNVPMSCQLPLFIWLSGLRWAIEQCFEETKTEFGLDHYEVHKYPGWHHHMMTCMLAYFFLWHLKIRLGKKAPSSAHSQLRTFIGILLPMRWFDMEMGFAAGPLDSAQESPSLSLSQEKETAYVN